MGAAKIPKIPGLFSDPCRSQEPCSPRPRGGGCGREREKTTPGPAKAGGTWRCSAKSSGKRGRVFRAGAAPFCSGRFSGHAVSQHEKRPRLQLSSRRSPFLSCLTAVSPYSKPSGRRRRWPVPTWRNKPPPGSPGQSPKPPRTRRRPCTPAEGPRWRA